MGREVALACAASFKRAILELAATTRRSSAPVPTSSWPCVPCCFPRWVPPASCTTLRRVFIHESVYEPFVARLQQAWENVTVATRARPATLVGPLIDGAAFDAMQRAGRMPRPGRPRDRRRAPAAAVPRCLLRAARAGRDRCPARDHAARDLRPHPLPVPSPSSTEAIALNNAASHGLSSAIFTERLAARPSASRPSGERLWHRQRQHRHQRCRDRQLPSAARKDSGAGAVRLGRLEVLHAALHQHRQLGVGNCRLRRASTLAAETPRFPRF